jgi:ATP-binding cassette subfamily F protein uup
VDPQGRGSAPHAQRGPRARLVKLREQRAQRRDQLGQVRLELDAGPAARQDRGRAEGREPALWRPHLIDHFSATILRGDKVGLIGPNGCGKTTLLKLILGELQPTSAACARAHGCRWPTSTRCAPG